MHLTRQPTHTILIIRNQLSHHTLNSLRQPQDNPHQTLKEKDRNPKRHNQNSTLQRQQPQPHSYQQRQQKLHRNTSTTKRKPRPQHLRHQHTHQQTTTQIHTNSRTQPQPRRSPQRRPYLSSSRQNRRMHNQHIRTNRHATKYTTPNQTILHITTQLDQNNRTPTDRQPSPVPVAKPALDILIPTNPNSHT